MTLYSTAQSQELAQQIRATTIAFLQDRLNERSSIEWALELDDRHLEERNAIRDLLVAPRVKLKEPFRTAWFWLLESWDARPRNRRDRYALEDQIQRIGLNGDALRSIVDLVRPWPKLDRLKGWLMYGGPAPPKKPRKLSDLVSISIRGGDDLVSLNDLGLQQMSDVALTQELADRLESALQDGLHVARRLGWITQENDLTRHDVRHVYRVSASAAEDGDGGSDPDMYHHGFAPIVKLLFEVVGLLEAIDAKYARTRVDHWKSSGYPIFRRLWAALARSSRAASPEAVSDFLAESSDREFWKPIEYPEIAELRASRFKDLDSRDQVDVEERIKRLPPTSHWQRRPTAKNLARYRHVCAAIELKRILVGGGKITDQSRTWLEDVEKKYEIPTVRAIDFDFEITTTADWVSNESDVFTALDPKSALADLNSSFDGDIWSDNARAAESYIAAHLVELLTLFSNSPELGAKNPNVWRQILRLHRPTEQTKEKDIPGVNVQAEQVLTLLLNLPETVLEVVSDGLASWMADWAVTGTTNSEFAALWLRAWPFAVKQTNRRAKESDSKIEALVGDHADDHGEKLASAALNTPAGHLMSAFLRMCPNLKAVPSPFFNSPLGGMRRAAISAEGAARLQVLHRFLSSLEYMRRADEEWTNEYLLKPLNQASETEIEIWDAIARNPVLSSETMTTIGARMAEIAQGSALPIDARARLGERIVYRVLLDRNQSVMPSVSDATVQQMLRLGSDQLRSSCGRMLGVFLDSVDGGKGREARFEKVVRPFLETVWPKERTLASRGLSDALAGLPAKSGAAFAEAVRAIRGLLTPFDVWSLHEYSLYSGNIDAKNLRKLDGPAEAAALLELLDVTIGSEERAVRPFDLDRALVLIRSAAPKLVRDTRYARLSALVRQ